MKLFAEAFTVNLVDIQVVRLITVLSHVDSLSSEMHFVVFQFKTAPHAWIYLAMLLGLPCHQATCLPLC